MTPLQILTMISQIMTVIITVCFAYQVIYLFVPLFVKSKPHKENITMHRYGVLIAARNEEKVLSHLLHSLALQDYPQELLKVYVVADNCTDRTAEVARKAGATVFSRSDTTKIGKGRALHFLLDQIKASGEYESIDAFLIFDADNVLDPGYITNMNRTCCDGFEAFCGYRNAKNFGTNWISAGHAMWYLHDCVHLNQSRFLLGIPCAVTGTGFGFTRKLLDQQGGWNFFALTEDIEFSVWCALHKIKIGYCHDAILYDEQPVKVLYSFRQRVRWVQGTMQISVRYLGQLLRGLGAGGRFSYASLENLTLTIWGYLFCAAHTIGTTVLSVINLGLPVTLILTGCLAALAILYMLLTAALILYTERKRIRATRRQRILGLFAYPVYLISFFPIFFMAVFSKFDWPPIEHSVAVSPEELNV